MAKDTKERILEAALDIFARDGYSGTNIKDIAEAVGIVKSALYRHFDSKEDIWNAVYEMMISYYEAHFGSVKNMPDNPQSMEELYEMTMRMVNFTINDEKVIKMRKILVTEQFRYEKVKKLASNYFLYDTEAIFSRIFEKMMDNGIMMKEDPVIAAFSYTAPVTVLVHFCDREPDKKPEALEKIDRFIRYFIAAHGNPAKADG